MNSTLWMLTFVNLICYLDRYIISAVAPKVELEFGLSHGQTGLFMSLFMVGYMLTSPLFGYFGDRKARPVLMGIGVLVWSFATLASGMATHFWPLLLARALVGVGEASFATLAPPFIRDSLKDESTMNRVLGVFYTAIPVGAAIGIVWGGWMADHYNWRWAFYLGAIPGFALAVFVLKMREPGHRTREMSEVGLIESVQSLLANRAFKLSVLAYTAQTFALGGFSAWAPQYGVTVLGVSLTDSSMKIGASTVLSGLIGTMIGGKWGHLFLAKGADRGGADAVRAFCKFCAWTSVIATPLAFWAFRAENFNEFVIALFLVQLFIFAALAPANTAIISAVPSKMAATAFAVSILTIHALGDVISPPLAGYLSDQMPMSDAMQVLVVALAISAVIWFVGAKSPGEGQ
jgi:MFS transporter, Spinster family, sphingosine-1-phosphate transporter